MKIKHYKDRTKCLTPCPHGKDEFGAEPFVGSEYCRNCKHYEDEYFDNGVRILECNK